MPPAPGRRWRGQTGGPVASRGRRHTWRWSSTDAPGRAAGRGRASESDPLVLLNVPARPDGSVESAVGLRHHVFELDLGEIEAHLVHRHGIRRLAPGDLV